MTETASTHDYKRARTFFQSHVLAEDVEVVTSDTIARHYGIQARRDTPTPENAPDPVYFAYTQEYVDLIDQLNVYADQADAAMDAYDSRIERIVADAGTFRPTA